MLKHTPRVFFFLDSKTNSGEKEASAH